MTKQTRRHRPEDWIQAGFRALVVQGPAGLKAEALARAMKTTKGSFYWHFEDMTDFKERLLRHWEERAFHALVEDVSALSDPRERLGELCLIAVSFRDQDYGGAAAEPALRAWAREDPKVAERVRRMDTNRLEYLGNLCREAGLGDGFEASLLYAIIIGLDELDLSADQAKRAMAGCLSSLGVTTAGMPRN